MTIKYGKLESDKVTITNNRYEGLKKKLHESMNSSGDILMSGLNTRAILKKDCAFTAFK